MKYSWVPLLIASCGTFPSASDRFQDRLLATIPEGTEVRLPVAFSRDGLHCAYMANTGDGWHAVRGAWKSRRLGFL